jgi:hypothetical protein
MGRLEALLQTERKKLAEYERVKDALESSRTALQLRSEDLEASLVVMVRANDTSLREAERMACELNLLRTEQATKDAESAYRLASMEDQFRRLLSAPGGLLPDDSDQVDDLVLKKKRILAMLHAVETAEADLAKKGPECPVCLVRNGTLRSCPLRSCRNPGRGMACGDCAQSMVKCLACT